MEKSILCGPCKGGEEDPKGHFCTGNGGSSRGDVSSVKSWSESGAIPRRHSPAHAHLRPISTPGTDSLLQPGPARAILVTLTWAAVELAGLGDVPFAQPCPLANGGPDPVHIVLGQDGVEEDAPGVRSRQRLSRGWESPALRLFPAVE